MSESPSHNSSSLPSPAAAFAQRAPSTQWELLSFAAAPQSVVWVWFKPEIAPHGLLFRIPDETFQSSPDRQFLSMRTLLHAAGIDPTIVESWQYVGLLYDAQRGANPALDQLLAEPPVDADPHIIVRLATSPTQSAPVTAPGVQGALQLLEAIEADWNASLKLEQQLTVRRKELAMMLNRINALNRDLTPEERLHGDRLDQNAWQAARRWLRDVAAQLSRYIKEHDIGDASGAGKRQWFENTYEQFIAPRREFAGIEQVQRDYEAYRRMLRSLLNNMNLAHSSAAQDGERRAQQILNKLAAKVRAARPGR